MARKRLCTDLKLRGIVFGGRIPGLARAIGRYGSAEAYVQAVVEGSRRDPTLSFQLRNGFEVIGLLRGYVPSDHESLGYAAHLVWRNPHRLDQPDMVPKLISLTCARSTVPISLKGTCTSCQSGPAVKLCMAGMVPTTWSIIMTM